SINRQEQPRAGRASSTIWERCFTSERTKTSRSEVNLLFSFLPLQTHPHGIVDASSCPFASHPDLNHDKGPNREVCIKTSSSQLGTPTKPPPSSPFSYRFLFIRISNPRLATPEKGEEIVDGDGRLDSGWGSSSPTPAMHQPLQSSIPSRICFNFFAS
ncbi:hypothetical protein B296_00041655, partial [Ensete ventricosum]